MKTARLPVVTALVLVAVLAAVSAAATGDIAEALPQSAMIVVRIPRLGEHWRALVDSPLAKQIENGPLSEVANGIREARKNIEQIELELALDVDDMLDAIFGHDIAITVFDDETVAFIARAEDAGRLRTAIETIIGFQQQGGEITDDKTEYYHQVEIRALTLTKPDNPAAPVKTRCHTLVNDLLVVSESREVVKRVIDVVQKRSPALAASAEYREARKHMTPGAVAQLYANTDRVATEMDLDHLLNGKMSNPVVQLCIGKIRELLPLTRYSVINLAPKGNALEITHTLAYDEQKLPDKVKALVPRADGRLDVVSLIPDSAVLAFANRADKVALWQYALNTLSAQSPFLTPIVQAYAQQFVGNTIGAMDFEQELLPQIRDQFAVIITPGNETQPPAVSIVMEIADTQTIPVSLKTIAGVVSTISWVEANKSSTPPKVLIERPSHRGTRLTTVVIKAPDLAGKLNPTLFVIDNFMVISTSPHAARAIIDAHAQAAELPGDAPRKDAPATMGHINVSALAGLARQYRDFLVKEGLKEGKTQEKAEGDIDGLIFLLGLLDRVDFETTSTLKGVRRTVTIHGAAPAAHVTR